jgi:hypothetical protein
MGGGQRSETSANALLGRRSADRVSGGPGGVQSHKVVDHNAGKSSADAPDFPDRVRSVQLTGMILPNMGADAFSNLTDHGLGGRLISEPVQEPKVMNDPVVAR